MERLFLLLRLGRGGRVRGTQGNEGAHLDDLVPSGRDDDGVHRVRREANARDPLGVAVLGDVELALSERVPQLDGAVTRTRNDLAVVGRERDREDVRGVADEPAGGQTRVEVPETQGLVPRGREGKLAVRRDDDVRDEAVVAVQDPLRVAERGLCVVGVERSALVLEPRGRIVRAVGESTALVSATLPVSLSCDAVVSSMPPIQERQARIGENSPSNPQGPPNSPIRQPAPQLPPARPAPYQSRTLSTIAEG